MRALAMMLHVCKTVDLYGFRGVVGYRSWYWEKYQGFQVRACPSTTLGLRCRRPLGLARRARTRAAVCLLSVVRAVNMWHVAGQATAGRD